MNEFSVCYEAMPWTAIYNVVDGLQVTISMLAG